MPPTEGDFVVSNNGDDVGLLLYEEVGDDVLGSVGTVVGLSDGSDIVEIDGTDDGMLLGSDDSLGSDNVGGVSYCCLVGV